MKLALLLCLLAAPVFSQTGEVVVATRQVALQTNTKFFKLPVEAQRGEQWQVVKKDKKKVIPTFGPQDERAKMVANIGIKAPAYEIAATDFAASFITASEWPTKRRALATEIQARFTDLSPEQCERIIDGEYWIGMKAEHATEIAGNRIFSRERSATAEGQAEVWKVGFFSVQTTAQSATKSHAADDLTATPSRPNRSLDEKIERAAESNVRFLLTFKNGALAEIVRRWL